MNRRSLALLALGLGSCGPDTGPVRVRIHVENVSGGSTFVDSQGMPVEIGIAPGLVVASPASDPMFTVGQLDRGVGLETLAEAGTPLALQASLEAAGLSTAVFELADVTYAQGAIGPGQAFTIELDVPAGNRLHLATMFGQSNDWFYATTGQGIDVRALPTSGTTDVTSEIDLFDAGTEVDETLFEGSNQGPRQATPDAGTPQSLPVSLVTEPMVLPVEDTLRVTVERI